MYSKCVVLFIFIFLFCFGCSRQRGTSISNAKDQVYLIKLEDCLASEKQMLLSSIADTIKYLELKIPSSIVAIGAGMKLSKDYIFINTRNYRGPLYQFTMDGDFVREVGKRGNGPGEYSVLVNYTVNEDEQEILILDVNKIDYYSFDGVYLRSLQYKGEYETFMPKDLFLYGSNMVRGNEPYLMTILDCRMDTIGGIMNNNINDPGEGRVVVSSYFRDPFYLYDKSLFFKGYYDNDTIWRLNGLNYETHAIIDMGRFKSPIYSNTELMKRVGRREGDYYWIRMVSEDFRSIYLSCEPYWNLEMHSPRIVFNKGLGTGFVSKTETGHFGIVDDILGGPAFWPVIITDKYYVSIVEPVELLSQCEKLSNTNITFKNFLNTIDEDKSNTIVILAKRK